MGGMMPLSAEPVPSETAVRADPSLAWRAIIQVFYKPTKIFAELKENPRVLVPYVLLGLLMFGFVYLTSDLIYQMQMDNPEVRERLGETELTPQMVQGMKVWIIFGGTAAVLIGPLLYSLIAQFWGNFVFAGKASFKQILSVVLYGEVLFFLGQWLLMPLIIAKQSLFVGFHLGVFMPIKDPTNMAYMGMTKIGLFNIWELIAVGIGLAIVYTFPRNKGILMAVLSIGLLSVLQVLLAGI
jgi:hypothetical protein